MSKILFIFMILYIPFLILNAEIIDNPAGIEFTYTAPNANSVSLVGTFNNWNNSANPMQKDQNGVWSTVIQVQAGKYQYKYLADGTWNYDQDNSETADDGYGGQNSAFEVGSDGKLVKKTSSLISGIKTSLNPKITFNGRYYTQNMFVKNNYSRYALQKPLHDIDLAPTVKFSNDFTARFVWKVNNQLEGADMYKTHLKYQNSELNLHTDVFNLKAFDNIGGVRFDDPMHFVGDDGKYHYDLGWGFRGIDAKSASYTWNGLTPSLEGVFLDGTRIADFHEGDLVAGRATLGTMLPLKPMFGSSMMNVRIPVVDRQYQNHDSYAFDLTLTDDLYNWGNVKPLRFQPYGEYYWFKNQNVDSTKVTWLKGDKIYGGMDVIFPKALDLYGNYEKILLKFPTSISKQQVKVGGNFVLSHYWIKADAQYSKYTYPDSAQVLWSDYYRYIEKTNGNGRWFQQYSDVPWEQYTVLGYPESILFRTDLGVNFSIWKWLFTAQLLTKSAQTKITTQPKYIENTFNLEWQVAKSWYIGSSTRVPYYKDNFLGLKTDIAHNQDFFWSNYSQLEYRIASNIKVAVGWGVNPQVLNTVTDDITNQGRDYFLGAQETLGNAAESQIESAYFGLGNYIRKAEKALKDEQRINITATMSF